MLIIMIDLYKCLSKRDAEDPDTHTLSLSNSDPHFAPPPRKCIHHHHYLLSSPSSRRLQAPASAVANSVIIVDKVL